MITTKTSRKGIPLAGGFSARLLGSLGSTRFKQVMGLRSQRSVPRLKDRVCCGLRPLLRFLYKQSRNNGWYWRSSTRAIRPSQCTLNLQELAPDMPHQVTSTAIADVPIWAPKGFGNSSGFFFENHRQFWSPPGFSHGFLTLTDAAEFLYKTTDFYVPSAERCIAWNEADIGIHWPEDMRLVLSARDAQGSPLAGSQVFA